MDHRHDQKCVPADHSHDQRCIPTVSLVQLQVIPKVPFAQVCSVGHTLLLLYGIFQQEVKRSPNGTSSGSLVEYISIYSPFFLCLIFQVKVEELESWRGTRRACDMAYGTGSLLDMPYGDSYPFLHQFFINFIFTHFI